MEVILERVDVTERDARDLCNDCVFRKPGRCLIIALQPNRFNCEENISKDQIVTNKNYIWRIKEKQQ